MSVRWPGEGKGLPMPKLQVGLIGCGGIAQSVHLKVLKRIPSVDVLMLLERRARRASYSALLRTDRANRGSSKTEKRDGGDYIAAVLSDDWSGASVQSAVSVRSSRAF